MYRIHPFIITNYDNMSVIQNAKATVILKSEEMIQLFNWVDENNQYFLENKKIYTFFKENEEKAIGFMLKNKLIEKHVQKDISYNNITVVSNDEVFLESIKFNSKGSNYIIKTEKLPLDISQFKVQKPNDLYVVFLNPFNYSYFLSLVEKLSDNNILCRVGFYYNNMVFLSNYYKNEWKNPCPSCFFSNIEAMLRAEAHSANSVSFVNLVDLIYKKDPCFNFQNNFTNKSMLLFVSIILNELEIEENSLINNVKYIDFINNKVEVDQAMYWELCDCYE